MNQFGLPRWTIPFATAAVTLVLGGAIYFQMANSVVPEEERTLHTGESISAGSMIEQSMVDAGAEMKVFGSKNGVDPELEEEVAEIAKGSSAELLANGEDRLNRKPPRVRDAIRFFEKAGLLGNVAGMQRAASVYESAPSPIGSRVRAYSWWTVAQALGADVSKRRELLSELMTEKELESGQRMAAQHLTVLKRNLEKEKQSEQ